MLVACGGSGRLPPAAIWRLPMGGYAAARGAGAVWCSCTRHPGCSAKTQLVDPTPKPSTQSRRKAEPADKRPAASL